MEESKQDIIVNNLFKEINNKIKKDETYLYTNDFILDIDNLYNEYNKKDIEERDLGKGYLMQDFYDKAEEYEALLEELNEGNELSEEEKSQKTKLEANFNKLVKIYPNLIKNSINLKKNDKFNEKNNIDISGILGIVQGYYFNRIELNSGAHPGCDCGCGGDTINFNGIYKYLERNEELVTKLSMIESFISAY